MCQITAVKDDKTGHYKIDVTGHATGSEKCCAAVSAMVCSVGAWLLRRIDLQRIVDTQKGNAHLEWWAQSSDCFDMLAVGFETMANKYPEFVSFTCQDR